MENSVKRLEKLQTKSQQQLKEKEDIITLLHSLVQSKTNEIQLLQRQLKAQKYGTDGLE
jgi:hypothetical protein